MRAICVAIAIALPASAFAKSPVPEFGVISILQERLARNFAERCTGLEFDHAGHNRHILARIAKYSDMGIHSRTLNDRFAPIPPFRYQRHIDRFNETHGLDQNSTLNDFCSAAEAEAAQRTPIGQMLKPVKDPQD